MREIKFRGKRLDNGEWVYGCLVYGVSPSKEVTIVREGGVVCRVDPDTVGQYTGFVDIYNKDIFEGDTVKCWSGTLDRNGWELEVTIRIDSVRDGFTMDMLYKAEEIRIISRGNVG